MDAFSGAKTAGAAAITAYESEHTAVSRPVSVGYIQFEEVMGKAFADIRNGTNPDTRLQEATRQLTDAWRSIK